MRPIVFLVLLAVLSPVARAGEADSLERALEALVRQAVDGPEVDDPSPTSLVAELLRGEPKRLRELLKRHWEERHLYTWDAARALEEIACLLFGRTPEGRDPGTRPPACGLWEFRGVVMVRNAHDGARWDGPFRGEDLPGFDEYFRKLEFRSPPAPEPAEIWSAFEAGAQDDWGEAERISFTLALGEVARREAAVRKTVIAAARARPRSRLLTVALGRIGGTQVAALLADRCRLTAPHRYLRPPAFSEAVRFLGRIDADRLQTVVEGLDPQRRDWVMSEIGASHFLPRRLIELDAAEDADARQSALDGIADIIGRHSWGSGDERDRPRLIRILARELPRAKGEDRAVLYRAAQRVLHVVNSFPISGSFSAGGGSSREQGRWVGPIGGIEDLLQTLVEDLDTGGLVALDPDPRWREPVRFLCPPPMPVKADGSRARTKLPCPIPNMTRPDREFPVHASFERADGGVRLTLRNIGREAFLVSPVALRYGSMSISRVDTRKAGEGKKSHVQLKLELGRLWGPFAVPAGRLARVEPGGKFSWVVPVPMDLGEITMVVISLRGFPIDGRTDGPVVLHINDTWLR